MTMSNEIPDFQGKVVGVQMKDMPTGERKADWWWLDSPILQVQAGRLFLVGKAFMRNPEQPRWCDGVLICNPWENISYYTVETYENYHTNTRRLAAQQDDRSKQEKPKEERRGWW